MAAAEDRPPQHRHSCGSADAAAIQRMSGEARVALDPGGGGDAKTATAAAACTAAGVNPGGGDGNAPTAFASVQGLADIARHLIQRTLNPRFSN